MVGAVRGAGCFDTVQQVEGAEYIFSGAWGKHSSDEMVPGKIQGFILSPEGALHEPVPLKIKPFSAPETSSLGLSWSQVCRLPPL